MRGCLISSCIAAALCLGFAASALAQHVDADQIKPCSALLSDLAPLCLAPSRVTLEQRATALVDRVAPSRPMEEWAPGLTVAEQTGRTIASFEDPIDIVLQYRIPIDFCPDYLPQINPGLNNDQLCRRELLTSWQLEQDLQTNPFQVAVLETQRLNEDADTRRERLSWLAGYAWLHRDEQDVGVGMVDLLLSDTSYAKDDVIATALGPLVLRRLPEALKTVSPGPDEVPIDLRVTPEFAYDSVATNEQMLLNAAVHGMKAIVIAGRTQLGDAQVAVRLAERMKREGRLPADFRVVIGQYVASRTGDVVGIFLEDRVLEGQTMAETVEEIHRQGGLAYMARPGDIGAPASLERLPFDGYLIQPGNFELFRTLLLLDDPRFADKPALYASNAKIGFLAGLPYSNVRLDHSAADPLKAGLAQRQGYAAGTLYFPWMMALLTKPIAVYQTTLNRFFQFNDALVVRAGRFLRSDNIVIRTSWDEEMRDLINIWQAPSSLHRLWSGGSPLRQLPEITYVEAEYGRVAVGYDRLAREWHLASRWRW
ncbi:MAG: hypothetical protein ACYC63_10530 [Armatimonadota bacterium]